MGFAERCLPEGSYTTRNCQRLVRPGFSLSHTKERPLPDFCQSLGKVDEVISEPLDAKWLIQVTVSGNVTEPFAPLKPAASIPVTV